jgi:hypothetical protein
MGLLISHEGFNVLMCLTLTNNLGMLTRMIQCFDEPVL